MRKLQTTDVFAAARLMQKIGIGEEMKKISAAVEGKTETELGIETVFAILEKAIEKKSEHLIYEFVGSIAEITAKEVAEMDPFDLVEQLMSCTEPERWKTFFMCVQKLIARS